MSMRSAHSETLCLLENPADFQEHALQLAASTHRQLTILSRTLDAPIYDTGAFSSTLSALARRNRYTQIHILVKDTQSLIERGHKLARLAQRLPSKITLRKLTLEPENSDMGFMLCDQSGLLYKNDERQYRGFSDTYAPAEVKRLREIFEYLWQYAEPEPRLQILHI